VASAKPAPFPATAVSPHWCWSIAAGEALTRDLINTPAEDMGPRRAGTCGRDLAGEHGAQVTGTHGDGLLDANLPLIHTVGRASDEAPADRHDAGAATGPR
jgi:leucyl aminopeptidase